MKNKLANVAGAGLGIGLLVLLGLTAFSPYGHKPGFAYKAVVEEIEINATPSAVYTYLGKSANASKWSVFVDHIVPLNADQVSDGRPGSFRRCFQKRDETGMVWDEEITVAERAKRRQLTIFNMRNFPVMARGLATEQLYDSLSGRKTRLRFTLFFNKTNPGLTDELKTYLAAWEVARIYRQNMRNIKADVETGQ